ncbi:MAG: hypothetical protein LLF76_02345 [Planctomycetaceae bacterium]|nr:hypothetical protein [Planctomycetaceae bacterium]
MEAKISKKSYYIPDVLHEFFAEWCSPGRDYSPKVAAGIILYMAMYPEIQQAAEKLAHTENLNAAILELRQRIDASVVNRKRAEFVATLTEEQKGLIDAAIAGLKEKSPRKK